MVEVNIRTQIYAKCKAPTKTFIAWWAQARASTQLHYPADI